MSKLSKCLDYSNAAKRSPSASLKLCSRTQSYKKSTRSMDAHSEVQIMTKNLSKDA